jgi:hypothetical protein
MTYGLPGTPTVQHLRDYGFTSVSGIGGTTNIVGATTPILPDVSSLPGSTVNSQYVIWGVICASTADAGTDAVFAGYLINTQDAHTAYADASSADDAVILSFATTKQGPFFFSTDHPIEVPKGSGVSLDANGTTSNNIVYLYYSIKN